MSVLTETFIKQTHKVDTIRYILIVAAEGMVYVTTATALTRSIGDLSKIVQITAAFTRGCI